MGGGVVGAGCGVGGERGIFVCMSLGFDDLVLVSVFRVLCLFVGQWYLLISFYMRRHRENESLKCCSPRRRYENRAIQSPLALYKAPTHCVATARMKV